MMTSGLLAAQSWAELGSSPFQAALVHGQRRCIKAYANQEVVLAAVKSLCQQCDSAARDFCQMPPYTSCILCHYTEERCVRPAVRQPFLAP